MCAYNTPDNPTNVHSRDYHFLLPCIIVTKHNTAGTCSTYHRSHENTVAREVLLGIILIDKGFIIAVHELEVHNRATVWLVSKGFIIAVHELEVHNRATVWLVSKGFIIAVHELEVHNRATVWLVSKGFIIAVHELEVHSRPTVWLARTDSGTQLECWNFGMSSKLGQKEGEVLYAGPV